MNSRGYYNDYSRTDLVGRIFKSTHHGSRQRDPGHSSNPGPKIKMMKMTWFSRSQIEMLISESDRWYVQLDGRPVAIIEHPTDADMFWFTWEVVPLGETPIPTDLWDYSTDSRRSFRHLETDELDPGAFPGGKGLLESGRVLICGPLRNRGHLLDDQYRAPKSRIRRLLQWVISLPRIGSQPRIGSYRGLTPRIRSSLPWIITFVALCTSLSILVATRSIETVSERFPRADGIFVRAEYVDLSTSLRVNLRYSPIADVGVEIEMLRSGRHLWNAYVEGLGTAHSAYEHSVECLLDNGDLVIRSKGSSGEVIERRNLRTGKLIDRVASPRGDSLEFGRP